MDPMNQASLKTSPRLRRALAALQRNPNGLTTRGWIREANICACNSIAAELKANGVPITCHHEGRRNGASLFRYRLVAK